MILNDKQIAITGHTRGFGKFIYDQLILNNLMLGFSKSTGTDITKKSDRESLIETIIDFDVFINCAHDGFGQTELLYELYDKWQHQNKMILNIGSNAKDFTSYSEDGPYKYGVQKSALNLASKQLGRYDECRVVSIDFGYFENANDKYFIPYSDAYPFVEEALKSFEKPYRVLEVTIAHPPEKKERKN